MPICKFNEVKEENELFLIRERFIPGKKQRKKKRRKKQIEFQSSKFIEKRSVKTASDTTVHSCFMYWNDDVTKDGKQEKEKGMLKRKR